MKNMNNNVSADFVGYTHEFLAEFIQLYHALPCLWEFKCKGYKDRLLRNNAYDVLVQKLREVNPSADRNTVIRKINTLRTAFRREYKRVKISENLWTDQKNHYKSSLWYYDLLKFVSEQEDNEISGISSNEENLATNISNDYEWIQTEVAKIEPSSPNPSRSTTPNNTNLLPMIPGTGGSHETESSALIKDCIIMKEKDTECVKNQCKRTAESAFDVSSKRFCTCSNQNELNSFGLYVTSKLKKCTERQSALAERIIADVLLRANLGTLDENTKLTEKPPSRCFLVMGDH